MYAVVEKKKLQNLYLDWNIDWIGPSYDIPTSVSTHCHTML